jgi:hypothetical protein
MSRYSKEKKEHALSLMAPPNNLPVAEVSARTGVTGAYSVRVAQPSPREGSCSAREWQWTGLLASRGSLCGGR